MVNSYIKAQGLQQNVLIANQLLSLDKTNIVDQAWIKEDPLSPAQGTFLISSLNAVDLC